MKLRPSASTPQPTSGAVGIFSIDSARWPRTSSSAGVSKPRAGKYRFTCSRTLGDFATRRPRSASSVQFSRSGSLRHATTRGSANTPSASSPIIRSIGWYSAAARKMVFGGWNKIVRPCAADRPLRRSPTGRPGTVSDRLRKPKRLRVRYCQTTQKTPNSSQAMPAPTYPQIRIGSDSGCLGLMNRV